MRRRQRIWAAENDSTPFRILSNIKLFIFTANDHDE